MKRSRLQLEADSTDRVCTAISRLANARSESERQQANRWVLIWERYYAKVSGVSSKTFNQKQVSTIARFDDQGNIKRMTLAAPLRRVKQRLREFFSVLRWIFRREQSMETRSQLYLDISVSMTK